VPTELTYHLTGSVGVITLNRPEARNALTRTTYAELEETVRTATARCLVITGADPAFCSGDDIKKIMVGEADRSGEPRRIPPRITPAADAILTCDIPIVAGVNGAAVGWGMELALMADIRVASERATFGEFFVRRGLCCDVAGLGRLAQLVGRERAAEMLFTGRLVDAAEAERIGLVSRTVAHSDLVPITMEIAEQIASKPPLAVQRIKRGMRMALDPDWSQLGAWVSTTLTELFATDDHREGVAAFLERREPTFKGA
jgi:enoyl-CoA hydratase